MMKPDVFKDKLHGVINLQLTPFDKHGDLDEAGLKTAVRDLVARNKGKEMVVLGQGTTGEFYAMSEQENARVAEIIVEEVNGVFPVLLGSARTGTRNTIEASKTMQKIGADAVMVVHPYYTMAIEEEVVRYYEDIAAAIDIGLVIYNNPATSKLWLNTKTIQKLSKVPNIIGLKENTGNPNQFRAMLDGLDPKDMAVFCGMGHFMFPYISLYGCQGFVTECSNYAPELAFALLKACREIDIPTIKDCVRKMNLIWDFIDVVAARRSKIPSVLAPGQTPTDMPYYQAVHKAAMDLCGLPGGYVRAPMCNLTDEERLELKPYLVEMGCTLV
jgi:4-hydroxy-tetrahydrodipicolinate synthase